MRRKRGAARARALSDDDGAGELAPRRARVRPNVSTFTFLLRSRRVAAATMSAGDFAAAGSFTMSRAHAVAADAAAAVSSARWARAPPAPRIVTVDSAAPSESVL